MRIIGWIVLIAVIAFGIASIGLPRSQEPSPETYIDKAIEIYIARNQRSEVAKRNHGAARGMYRWVQSAEELLRLYPDCCEFKKTDPEIPTVSRFTKWRTGMAGYVFIRAGEVRVSGQGPYITKPGTSIYVMGSDLEDLSGLFF